MSIELFFFQFLFSAYFCSIGPRIGRVLFQVVCNQSLPLHFYIQSLNGCINSSTLSSILVSLLPPSFLDTYSLSTSSLGCVVPYTWSFVFLFAGLFVYVFKNGPEYLTFVYLKKEQPIFAGWQSGLPSRQSEEHLPIMTPRPGSHFAFYFN